MEETALGGQERAFPTTLWSSILKPGKPDSDERRRTIEKLFSIYWKPVYCCVRFGWNKPVEDAKDVVQDFFADLLDRDFLKDVDPAKGRFRSFLKAALRNFMMNEKRDAARLKRGGGAKIVPLDGVEHFQAAPGDPDQVFDAEWLRSVLARAVDELRSDLTKAGKEKVFRVFELYDLAQGAEPTYGSVAKETGIAESDVRNHLHAARGFLRRILIRQISEYAVDERDVEEEIRWILG
ncbi:MAG: sigma-70 family RNA polymerase sigma factor [Planctomycetes bacterium]|nr:sigma-70 family RNA polymerase sigma factor [Planctomycetota bacterium]